MFDTILPIASIVFMAPGLILIFFPSLPAIPYMFIVSLGYGFIDKFKHLNLTEYLILGGIAILSILVDYFSGVLGAKYGGAGRRSIFFGFLGLIIGTLILPPFGGFIGLFLGVLIGEITRRRSGETSLKAASYSLLGSISGFVINIILAITFFILFLVFVF